MTPFVDVAVRFTIAVLFNGLWVAALLAIVAWIALRAMPNGNATTRHSILAAALYASLILPIVAALVTTLPHVRAIPTPQTHLSVPSHGTVPPKIGNVLTTRDAAPATTAVQPALARPSVVLPRPILLAIVAIWLLGSAVVLLRLIVSLLHLERLKSDALPVPIEYRARLRRWTAATKGSRNVRLCRSSEIVVPIAVGLFDAMILVPNRLLEELTPDDIDSIVLHELAHLRRGDDWVNAVERIAQAMLFFNPGILWLVSQLDLEREVACDDWVLQQNTALPYATCLARIVESVSWPYRAISAPGAFVTRRGMSVRIERLLASHRDVRVRTSFGPIGATIAALGALCIVAAFVAPSFAYTANSAVGPTIATAAKPAQPANPHVSPKPHVTSAPASTPRVSSPAQAPRAASRVAVSRPASSRVTTASPPASKTAVTAVTVVPTHLPTLVAATENADPSIERSIQIAANSPDYIDSLASVGYANLSIDDLIRLKAVGVTADYIRALQDAGLSHPSVGELIRLRATGVQPDYVRAVRTRFGSSASMNEIARLKAVGVTDAYLNALASAGYSNLTVEDAVRLRAVGVDSNFIALAASHGMRNLTVNQLIRLKASGIL